MQSERIDFIIIGATKSATTWLQRSLQADPGIFMPDPELHFFSREYDRGENWYWTHFLGQSVTHNLVGEKSNSYLEDDRAASRIHSLLPDVKLVVQIRNPVERAYSDYCMLYRRGEVGKDVDSYLNPKRCEVARFLRGGLYASQLERYVDNFSLSNILVVLYEDMKIDAGEHVASVRSFLGVDPYSVPPLSQRVKDRRQAVIVPQIRNLLAPAKPFLAPFRSSFAFKCVRSIVARRVNYSPLGGDLRKRMTEFYERDVEKLSVMLQRDLTPWLQSSVET